MSVVAGFPPNIVEIRKAFPVTPTTVYAYAPHIYVPSGRPLPAHLIVHEETHHRQQEAAGGPEAWWRDYIDDPGFRLAQEVEAYQAQWGASTNLRQAERRWLLGHIVDDLSSELYGNLVSADEAMKLVTRQGAAR